MIRAFIGFVLLALVAGCETPDGLIGSEVSFLPDMKANSVPASGAIVLREDGQIEEAFPISFSDGALNMVIPEEDIGPTESMKVRFADVQGVKGFSIAEIHIINPKAKDGKTSVATFALARRAGSTYALVEFDSAKVMQKGAIPGLTAKSKSDKTVERTASTSSAMYTFYERAAGMIAAGQLQAETFLPFEIIDTTSPGALDAILEQVAARKLAKKLEKEAITRQRKQTENKDKWYGKWLFTLSEDAITDERKLYVYSRPEGHTDWNTAPSIRIACNAAGSDFPMGASLDWRATLGAANPNAKVKFARVTARFDKDKPQEMVWGLASDASGTYAAGSLMRNFRTEWKKDWTPKDLHESLRNADRAVFRGYPENGQPVTLIFDLDGYNDAIANFEPHCNQ